MEFERIFTLDRKEGGLVLQHAQDTRLILKCCTMYYFDGMSQMQISKQLGVSHPTVCRLIKLAKEKGYVKIDIVSPLEHESYTILERELEKRFGLKEAVVIGDKFGDDHVQKVELGKAVAAYLQRVLVKNDVVGLSMGSTLYEVPKAVTHPTEGRNIFVPVLGAVGQTHPEIHPNTLVSAFAKAFGGEAMYLHAPAHITHHVIKENLLLEPSVQEVMKYYDKLSACVVGIGTPEPDSAMMRANYFDQAMVQQLFDQGMVGDICLQFYDINGNTDRFPINQNAFGMELEKLKSVPRSIGIATGVQKTKAVIGAIRAKFVNVLIVHRSLAESILSYTDEASAPATTSQSV